MPTSQNGILNRATEAKEKTEQVSIEEIVSLAWNATYSTKSNQITDKSNYYLIIFLLHFFFTNDKITLKGDYL